MAARGAGGIRWLLLAFGLFIAIGLTPTTAPAQQAGVGTPAATPPQVQELLRLLDDPAVQGWLKQTRTVTPPSSSPDIVEPEAEAEAGIGFIATHVAQIRAHVRGLFRAATHIDDEARRIIALLAPELRDNGLGAILLLFATFIGLGFGAEWLYWRLTQTARKRIIARAVDTPTDRLRAAGMRLTFGLGWVASFTIGSIGAFLIFGWPPRLREIVLTYLQVFLVIRLTIVLGRFAIAPGAPRFRIVPMSDAAARHWANWLVGLVGWFAFARLTGGLLAALGLARDVFALYISFVAFVWLVLGLVALWLRPPRYDEPDPKARSISWIATASLVVLWFVLLSGSLTAFWLGLLALLLPFTLRLIREAVGGLLRADGGRRPADTPASVIEVCLERGLHAATIIGAIYFVARLWDIDLASLAARDSAGMRLLVGFFNAVIIVLIADFAWHLLRVVIDGRVATAMRAEASPDAEEARRRSRLRTLLPIVRNLLSVVLVAIAAMMALSQLGVEIGPLIAGAGVVGVAIGFGAQTLVKDVISGMFYLLDDAFRVGEYIQSGNYKGTVESFSLRSVKLRHHRGPLYTVPFGTLGAIQNMSRDWVIDKLTVSVTYDSDLDKAKKLVKQIGKELAEDPEFKPHIIEPLKMQGVEAFGDYAVNLRLKMMTKPGEQFVIRRRAFALIKKAFEANDIRFAFPTVQIAGGGDGTAAAARMALDQASPKPEGG